MKILSASVCNFASYERLEINFVDRGLILVSGPTGAGKSTLCDIIPWVLFGRTAKDGAVDDIVRWNSTEGTDGIVYLKDGTRVVRVRGVKNDLYYSLPGRPEIRRGKDLTDTQKSINDILGTDADKYLASSYYHEFSQAASFFTASAKNRRQMTEQLVDLDLALKVASGAKDRKAELKTLISATENNVKNADNGQMRLASNIESHIRRMRTWETDKIAKITELLVKAEDFDLKEIEKATRVRRNLAAQQFCPACKQTVAKNSTFKVAPSETRINPYLDSLERATNEMSPHCDVLAEMEKEYLEVRTQAEQEAAKLLALKIEQADYITLSDLVDVFRGLLITRAISELEYNTNRLLNDHFDAEIRVLFNVESLDKLEVTILKDGNECSFSQLSKGQRQLLKLSFGVSVMRQVSNHNSISTNVAFFDESLDGLDDVLKVKAFSLLQEVAQDYESVFVVEHSSAFKERFVNRLEVSMSDGVSSIEEA